jgi:hypothetical protein
MNYTPIGLIICIVLFGSAMLAMAIARRLPEHHHTPETKSAVSVSIAVVGTVSAIVLGMLISTANGSFVAKTHEVTQISADLINLDRLLHRYGPQAHNLHMLVVKYTTDKIADLFPEDREHKVDLENAATAAVLETLQDGLLALTPANEAQTWLRSQALSLTASLVAARWQLGQEDITGSPRQLMVLMLFWFMLIFASFGLFAPRNGTVIAMILFCAIALGSAIRMKTELETPFKGLIRVSSAPLVAALDQINQP